MKCFLFIEHGVFQSYNGQKFPGSEGIWRGKRGNYLIFCKSVTVLQVMKFYEVAFSFPFSNIVVDLDTRNVYKEMLFSFAWFCLSLS